MCLVSLDWLHLDDPQRCTQATYCSPDMPRQHGIGRTLKYLVDSCKCWKLWTRLYTNLETDQTDFTYAMRCSFHWSRSSSTAPKLAARGPASGPSEISRSKSSVCPNSPNRLGKLDMGGYDAKICQGSRVWAAERPVLPCAPPAAFKSLDLSEITRSVSSSLQCLHSSYFYG